MVEITERDKKIFNILFRLRYMTAEQLSLYLGCTVKAVYDRTEVLINNGYLENEWFMKKKVYKNGIRVRRKQEKNSYKRKVHILKYTLTHHLAINDIYIQLVNGLGIDEDDITTEREMFWKRIGLLDKRKKIKIPDLILKKGDRLVAIEYKKTLKKEEAIREIFRNYTLNTSFYCVRYLCLTNSTKEKINKVAKEMNKTFIKSYTIDKFFNGIDIFGF